VRLLASLSRLPTSPPPHTPTPLLPSRAAQVRNP
jgi:large subunit ribosomal protein L8e